MPRLPYLRTPGGVGVPALRVWKDPRVPYVGIVDSGADRSCIALEIAEALGIKFDRGEVKTGLGVGGEHSYWSASEDVERQSAAGRIRLPTPSINEALKGIILLGREDVFADYRVSFDQRAQTFSMTPYKTKR